MALITALRILRQVVLCGFKVSFVSTSLTKTTQGDPVFIKKEGEEEEEKEQQQ